MKIQISIMQGNGPNWKTEPTNIQTNKQTNRESIKQTEQINHHYNTIPKPDPRQGCGILIRRPVPCTNRTLDRSMGLRRCGARGEAHGPKLSLFHQDTPTQLAVPPNKGRLVSFHHAQFFFFFIYFSFPFSQGFGTLTSHQVCGPGPVGLTSELLLSVSPLVLRRSNFIIFYLFEISCSSNNQIKNIIGGLCTCVVYNLLSMQLRSAHLHWVLICFYSNCPTKYIKSTTLTCNNTSLFDKVFFSANFYIAKRTLLIDGLL